MTVPRLLSTAVLFLLLALPATMAAGEVPAPPVDPPAEAGSPPHGMAYVPGGEFEMGLPKKYFKKLFAGRPKAEVNLVTLEVPGHKVQVKDVWMDRYEVTNAQYLTYLEAAHKKVQEVKGSLNTLGKIAVHLYTAADQAWWRAIYALNWKKINPKKEDVDEPDEFPGGKPKVAWATKVLPEGTQLAVFDISIPKHWMDHGTCPPAILDHPVQWVSWRKANLFATWAGKRLPTEAEWERGARGPKNLVRTWGGTWSKDDWKRKEARVNWAELPGNHPARAEDRSILTTPVGSFPKGMSGFGMFDMLGNLWEWTDAPLTAYPESKIEEEDWWPLARVIRGGAYSSVPFLLRTTFRTAGTGTEPIRDQDCVETIGFRCVRSLIPGADRAYQTWVGLARGNELPKERAKPIEFAAHGGIGTEALRYEPRPNHVFVVGASRAIAILPRTRIPENLLKDLNARAEKAPDEQGLVVALLHTDIALTLSVPPKEEGGTETEGTLEPGDYVVSMHGGRLQILKTDIMGFKRLGYLTTLAKREKHGPLVEVARLGAAKAVLVMALGLVKITFPVDRRATGKDRFVFRAVLKTAQEGVLNIDWKEHK